MPIRGITASNLICSISCSPNSSCNTTLASGMEELHRKLIDHGFSKRDWDGDQFVRLRALKRRLDLLKVA